MPIVYLGLGSNKGERIQFIESALLEISKINDTKIIRTSSVYETEPWGNIKQNDFLNSVIEVYTSLNAENLLKSLKAIEKNLGRTDNKKWFEREIDIDLLFYGRDLINNESMKIPHPQIENRNFVLIPMNELASNFIHPVLNKTISALLSDTKDDLKVIKYQTSRAG